MDSWSQRTLLPPPCAPDSATHRLIQGLDTGDAKFDALLEKDLIRAVHGHSEHISPDPEPSWADKESIRRGQAVYMRYFAFFKLALTQALLHGFVIGRFSDVLVLAGYTRSNEETFMRFKLTAQHIRKWMVEPNLMDAKSEGRQSLMQVRCMHAFARKRARSTWEAHKSEGKIGIPLSQFDMAMVQLGFSSVAANALERELCCPITKQEKQDYYHLWRYLGWHLGIHDAFNVCVDATDSERLRDEFYSTIPHYTKYVRPSTFEMVRSTLDGFGAYSGLGNYLFGAFLVMPCRDRPWLDVSYLNLDYPTVALPLLRTYFKFMGSFSLTRWVFSLQARLAFWLGSKRAPSLRPTLVERYVMPPISRASNFYWRTLQLLANLCEALLSLLFWPLRLILGSRARTAGKTSVPKEQPTTKALEPPAP